MVELLNKMRAHFEGLPEDVQGTLIDEYASLTGETAEREMKFMVYGTIYGIDKIY